MAIYDENGESSFVELSHMDKKLGQTATIHLGKEKSWLAVDGVIMAVDERTALSYFRQMCGYNPFPA